MVDEEDAGKRLDVFLAEQFKELSRSYIQKLIADGMVLVNNLPQRANFRLKEGYVINLRGRS